MIFIHTHHRVIVFFGSFYETSLWGTSLGNQSERCWFEFPALSGLLHEMGRVANFLSSQVKASYDEDTSRQALNCSVWYKRGWKNLILCKYWQCSPKTAQKRRLSKLQTKVVIHKNGGTKAALDEYKHTKTEGSAKTPTFNNNFHKNWAMWTHENEHLWLRLCNPVSQCEKLKRMFYFNFCSKWGSNGEQVASMYQNG